MKKILIVDDVELNKDIRQIIEKRGMAGETLVKELQKALQVHQA